MSYSFPKGCSCILVSTSEDGTQTVLQQNVTYHEYDKYDAETDVFDIPRQSAVNALKRKVKNLQAQGVTFFHFFGKDSRPHEFYLIGFVLDKNDR